MLVVPVVAAVLVFARRVERLETGPDAGVFVGMVRNLRSLRSLTSPTDQYWVRLSPAETVDRLGRLPIPDFGPMYSALVAVVPAPLELAFVIVHVAAVFGAVASVGYLAFRACSVVAVGMAAQVLALWGPFSPDRFFAHGRPLELYASIGSDGLAVATLLTGMAVAVAAGGRTSRTAWRWFGIAVAALLAASVLTRYAMAGAVLGLLVAFVVSRLRWDDRRWPWPVAALVVAGSWQIVVYPLLVDGAGPKSLVAHRGDIAPLGVTMAGWVGLDVSGAVASAVVIALGLVLVGIAVVGSPGGVVALCAMAAAGHLAVVVVSRQVLDAVLNLREERHVLLIRFLLAVLVVSGLHHLLRLALRRRPTGLVRRATAGAAALAAGIGAIAAGGWPWPDPLVAAAPTLPVDQWLTAHGSPPVLSNLSDNWYTQTGVPAADVPRTVEASTGRPRDVAAEIAALAASSRTVAQAYWPDFFEGVDLRTVPCAVVVDTWTGPELAGFELSILDLSGCT